MKAPIRQQLENVVILEYPVVFVFLPSHTISFEVIENVIPSTPKSPQKDSEVNLIPEGVSFREEEIEDDNNFDDPKVFDLLKHAESSPSLQVLTENMFSEKALNDSLDIPGFEGDIEGNLLPPSVIDTAFPQLPESGVFDFEQLMYDDSYGFDCAFPQVFPDFDSEFPKKDENEIDMFVAFDKLHQQGQSEQLEEGEIPD